MMQIGIGMENIIPVVIINKPVMLACIIQIDYETICMEMSGSGCLMAMVRTRAHRQIDPIGPTSTSNIVNQEVDGIASRLRFEICQKIWASNVPHNTLKRFPSCLKIHQ